MGASMSQVFRRPTPARPGALPPPLPATSATVTTTTTTTTTTAADDAARTGTSAGLQGISKNARKRVAREIRLQERKQARKAERRALQARKMVLRKTEREEMLRALPTGERERVQRERAERMRAGRAEDRAKRGQFREILATSTRYSVCIDLGWNDQMYDKERKSLARQLSYSYSALRKCVQKGLTPLSLSITGIDDVMKPVLTFVTQGWETWPIQLSERGLVDCHSRENLVYLTHDAEDVLQTLDPKAVYVVGGIVDRNRLSGATMNKAKDLGIRTARLNLDTNISIQHGSPVLTVNHCVEILIYAANGMSWRDAYLKVLPIRKGIREHPQ